MRLSGADKSAIKQLAKELFGEDAQVVVFGSRVDDTVKGGDLDLLVTTNRRLDNPVLAAAQMSAKAGRLMNGRSVDVLIQAPPLKTLPIHKAALENGQRL